ncbi:hypothetical protein [Amycolatopsis sp. H20-H5]|uniref:hypothetical protein n=1 Tax=Amycolatopsis sp. H20-H5 TaxID=3046309 RepID=UPI002DBFD0D2|nr:hypothetical protein [Amycolatopsis sp. H20-H5]MEC3980379.1 hypothetical protein [Amycolatopsis sp. H20-H5]
MYKSRRIAALAAFPVALGIALAAPAMASAAPAPAPVNSAATSSLTIDHQRGGLHLGGLLQLDGNRHHSGGHHRGLDLNLLLGLDLNLGTGHHGCDC